jgi:hypothetical protein
LGNFAGQLLKLFGERLLEAFEIRVLRREDFVRATSSLAVRPFQRQRVVRTSARAEASFFHGCHFDVVSNWRDWAPTPLRCVGLSHKAAIFLPTGKRLTGALRCRRK